MDFPPAFSPPVPANCLPVGAATKINSHSRYWKSTHGAALTDFEAGSLISWRLTFGGFGEGSALGHEGHGQPLSCICKKLLSANCLYFPRVFIEKTF